MCSPNQIENMPMSKPSIEIYFEIETARKVAPLPINVASPIRIHTSANFSMVPFESFIFIQDFRVQYISCLTQRKTTL